MAKHLLTAAGRIRRALEQLSRHYPEQLMRLTPRTDEEKTPGSGWLLADCTMPSGESLVRHLLYETRDNEAHGLDDALLCWLPAQPGLPAALPQILHDAGIRHLITPEVLVATLPPGLAQTCCWEGIDGSRIWLYFLPGTPVRHRRGESSRRTTDIVADDASDLETSRLRPWVGEWYAQHERGAMSVQCARENRRCELLLRDAEFFATIKPGALSAYPAAALEEAWKLVLRQQCVVTPGVRATQAVARDYRRVRKIADRVIHASMRDFSALVDTSKLSHPHIVWNTLPFIRGGLVSLPWEGADDVVVLAPNGQPARTQLTEEAGERRLLAEVLDVPSMGYLVVDLLEGDMPEEVTPAVTDEATAYGRVLENELVCVELDEMGGVVSFYDKQVGRELIADGTVGNRFQRVEAPGRRHGLDEPGRWGDELSGPAEMHVREDGKLRASFRVVRELTPRARMVQDIRLEANSRRLDFVTHIDWYEEEACLKVSFPMNIHSARASYEMQFGHVERPTHQQSWGGAASADAPAHKWADLSESDYGVALLNDGRYHYDIQGHVMRLTLQHAGNGPAARGEWGGHDVTYSLLPHRGEVTSSGVPLGGYDLNVPLYVRQLGVQEGILAQLHSYFRLDKPNLIIESVKRAEDGDGIIIRLYEAFRRRGTARLLINGLCSAVTRTDLRERNQHELEVQGGAILLHYRPFEIITLRLR